MAVHLGNVNFGVDAQTAGIQKAIQKMEQFARAVDRTARQQTQGAQQAAAAMVRQESAIKRAYQQVQNLRQQLNRVGGRATDLAQLSNAFSTLTNRMTSGQLSVVQYTRAMDAFNRQLGTTRRVISTLRADQAAKSTGTLATSMRNLASMSVLAVGPLSGVGSRIQALAAMLDRLHGNLGAVAAFAGITAGATASAIAMYKAVQATKQYEESFARFTAATGTIAAAREEMNFTIATARKLGLDFMTLSKTYSRFQASAMGTTLEGKNGRAVFFALSEAAAALKLNMDDVDGAMRAVEQMMSKGTIQAEELRGQLGERLPGAFRLVAESMGKTTKELGDLLKTGQLGAEEVLPLLAQKLHETFGTSAANNVNTISGAMNLLNTETTLFWINLDRSVGASKLFAAAINAATRLVRSLSENLDVIVPVIAAVGAGLAIMVAPSIIMGLVAITKGIINFTRSLAVMNTIMSANPFGRIATGVLKLGVVIGGAAFAYNEMSKYMEQLDLIGENVDNMLNDLTVTTGGLNKITEMTTEQMVEFQRTMRTMLLEGEAMARGSAAVEYYENVTSKVEEFKQKLLDTGVHYSIVNDYAAKYQERLEELVAQQKHYREVTLRAEQASTDFLENLLFRATTAKEALAGLAQELIKIAARNAIIEPLGKMLGGWLGGITGIPLMTSNVFNAGGVTGGGVQVLPSGVSSLVPAAANGANWKVGGSGGTDSKMVSMRVTPGELVDVTPAHRAGRGGGGGDINLTINAPGADAGTIARIREMIMSEMAPQIIQAATNNTMQTLRRPKYA